MLPILIALALSDSCRGFTTTEKHDELLLLPNQSNRISPFVFRADQGENPSTKLSLRFECSPSLKASFQASSPNQNVCDKPTFEGTLEDVNTFLASLQAQFLPFNSDDATLKYTWSSVNGNGSEVKDQMLQRFTVAKEIPIKMQTPIIHVASDSSNRELTNLVLTISDDYAFNAKNENLELRMANRPTWLSYSFKDFGLYMTLRSNQDLSDTNLNFNIVDRVTGLESEITRLQITFVDSAKKGASKTDSQLYFLIFLGLFTLVIIVFIFVLYFANKRIAGHEHLRQSIDGQKRANAPTITTNQSFDGKANVLSESIINWNKKLIARHQQKASMVLDVSEHKERESFNQKETTEGRNYQRFDDSDRPEEHSRDPQAEGFHDISEIHQDSASVKSQENHQKSSFLEDFKF